MATVQQTQATLDDLYRVEGKAELVNGRIVRRIPTGRKPNRVPFRIVRSLDDHAERSGRGEAYTDNMGLTVEERPAGPRSFAPDGSYYDGPFPANEMRFIHGPPTLAIEVRNEGGPASGRCPGDAADEARAEKRADYVAAGTLVVWDVDPLAECVHVYRHTDPANPTTFHRGDVADAEPAGPGWTTSVDEVLGRSK